MGRSKIDLLVEQAKVLYGLAVLWRTDTGFSTALDVIAATSPHYRDVFIKMNEQMAENVPIRDAMPAPESGNYFMPFVPVLAGIVTGVYGLGALLLIASNIVQRIAELEREGQIVNSDDGDTAFDFLMLAHLAECCSTHTPHVFFRTLSEVCSVQNKTAFASVATLLEADDSVYAVSDAMKAVCKGIVMPSGGQGMLTDEPNLRLLVAAEASGTIANGFKHIANTMMTNVLGMTDIFQIRTRESD